MNGCVVTMSYHTERLTRETCGYVGNIVYLLIRDDVALNADELIDLYTHQCAREAPTLVSVCMHLYVQNACVSRTIAFE